MTKNWVDLPPVPLVNIPDSMGRSRPTRGVEPAPTACRDVLWGFCITSHHRCLATWLMSTAEVHTVPSTGFLMDSGYPSPASSRGDPETCAADTGGEGVTMA